ELELRHARAVVPSAEAVVVVAARFHQLLVQVAFTRVVEEEVGVVLLVGHLLVAVLDGGGDRLAVVADEAVDDVELVLDVTLDVLEGEALGVLLAPVVEADADRLGALEARDVMPAEATQTADGLLAQVVEHRVLAERLLLLLVLALLGPAVLD